jgi:site-specific DNA recombinase
MKAAIYTRISRDDEEKGLGVERQRKQCRALLRQRGLRVARVFEENDTSAYSGKPRPQWVALLEAIGAGEIDTVVALANDRLYRRTRDQLDLMEMLESVRGRIITVLDGEVDPASAEGQMRMTILGSVAQFESKRKSERIREKHEQLAADGLYKGGGRPFGYRVVEVARGKSFEIVAREAEALREAAGHILDGQSLRSVALRWNAAGLRTPVCSITDPKTKRQHSREPHECVFNEWYAKSVKGILTSPTIAGLRAHRGAIVGKASWPAIIDRRTFDRLQAEFERRTEEKTGPVARKYLLTGLVRCGSCGDALIGHPQAGVRSYYCNSKKQHPKGSKVRISARPLEEYVTRQAADRHAVATVVAEPDAILSAELDALHARLTAFAVTAAEAGMSVQEIRAGREPLIRRIAGVEAEIGARATPRVKRDLGFLDWTDEQWAAEEETFYADPETRAWLETLVDAIVLKPAGRSRWMTVGQRTTVKWREGVHDAREGIVERKPKRSGRGGRAA